jgi:ATP-dependent DNA helicase RecG
MILNHLFLNRRADSIEIAKVLQRDVSRVGRVLEKLVEKGFIRAKREKRGRVYILDSSIYERFGEPWGYVRSINFDSIRQEQMVLQAIETYGKITRSQVSDLCGINKKSSFQIAL